jgi:hypothetical protein
MLVNIFGTKSLPKTTVTFRDEIDLYPTMFAELISPSGKILSIEGEGPSDSPKH